MSLTQRLNTCWRWFAEGLERSCVHGNPLTHHHHQQLQCPFTSQSTCHKLTTATCKVSNLSCTGLWTVSSSLLFPHSFSLGTHRQYINPYWDSAYDNASFVQVESLSYTAVTLARALHALALNTSDVAAAAATLPVSSLLILWVPVLKPGQA